MKKLRSPPPPLIDTMSKDEKIGQVNLIAQVNKILFVEYDREMLAVRVQRLSSRSEPVFRPFFEIR